MDWLSQYRDLITLLFSFVVAGATVFYAVLTRQLVAETRLLREAQTQPRIGVRVETDENVRGMINLAVTNDSQAPAYDLTFELHKDIDLLRGRHLSSIGFLKNGVRYLGPGQRVTSFLLSGFEFHKPDFEGDRLRFSLTATYRDALKRTSSERFDIDLSHMIGVLRVGKPALPSIADSLEKLQGLVADLTTGFRRIHVIGHTPESIRAEQERLLEELRDEEEEAPPQLPSDGSTTDDHLLTDPRSDSAG